MPEMEFGPDVERLQPETDRGRLAGLLLEIERVPADRFDGEEIERLEAVARRARKEW